MGNATCETRMCCKGENPTDEVRLAADTPNSLYRSEQTESGQKCPEFTLQPVNLSAKLAAVADLPPVLALKVLSSNALPQGSVLSIGPEGYGESLRGAKDGITYFGCKRREKATGDKQRSVVNDVLMRVSDAEVAEKHRGRHFEVTYRPERRSYWIRDLGVGFGAFLRLDAPIKLRDNSLLNLGESFIVVNLEPPTDRPRLKLKLFGGPCKGEVFTFAARDYHDSHIHIGRVPTCEIVIDDSLISKCHASMWYQQDGWVACDGDVEKLRSSTNGTWLYLNESCELKHGMVFKASQTLFEVGLD